MVMGLFLGINGVGGFMIKKLRFLIEYLLDDPNRDEYLYYLQKYKIDLGDFNLDEDTLFEAYRIICNLRMPNKLDEDFLKVEGEVLKYFIERDGIFYYKDAKKFGENIYLYKGDITRLSVDAIVNAANKYMLGCFVPKHYCIDNAIHTFSGAILRNKCYEIMGESTLDTSQVIVTDAYNLPSKYIFHTVGPIIENAETNEDDEMLKNCYINCIKEAQERKIKSLAFCAISTGAFGFDKKRAANIATDTILQSDLNMDIVFNVFSDEDYKIYEELLCKNC